MVSFVSYIGGLDCMPFLIGPATLANQVDKKLSTSEEVNLFCQPYFKRIYKQQQKINFDCKV